MTRKEEIENAAKLKRHDIASEVDYKSSAAYDGFVMGAKWADKTMLNKVCDWIQCMALDYITGDITDVKWGSMFADLRKYVENGDN